MISKSKRAAKTPKENLKREIYFKLSADDAKKWNLIFISFRMNCHTTGAGTITVSDATI